MIHRLGGWQQLLPMQWHVRAIENGLASYDHEVVVVHI